MPPAEDITGKKFRKLTAVKKVESVGRYTQWLFVCECGNEIISQTRHVKKKQGNKLRLCEEENQI